MTFVSSFEILAQRYALFDDGNRTHAYVIPAKAGIQANSAVIKPGPRARE
jgi:hypothetical protein